MATSSLSAQPILSQDPSCPRCGSTIQITEERPPHVALASKRASNPAEHDTVSQPAGCDHRLELDQLIRHLDAIERELMVIVRAIGNGVIR